MHVCFACTEVATFDGVVEQAMNTVAITFVVLCSVDSALCCDGVRTTSRVMECKCIDLVAKFCQRCRSRCTCKTSTYNNDFELAFVVGVDQLHVVFVVVPLVGHRAFWNLAVEPHCVLCKELICKCHESVLLRLGNNAGHDGDRE